MGVRHHERPTVIDIAIPLGHLRPSATVRAPPSG